MIPDIISDAESKMKGAVEHAREEFAAIRTGRAHPAMFNKLMVDYYGSPTPLQQLATFQVPEARTVLISPFDRASMAGVEKAIRDSDLGVNPTTDGIVIRVVFPQLTEQRRRELGKTARSKGEDAKVSIRNIRRKCTQVLDKLVKDGEVGEDDVTRAEKELQQITDRYTSQVDEMVKHKEAELLEV